MRPLRPLSLIEQTMEHFREGFRNGHWRGTLPGIRVLACELDVSKDTVEAALRGLEKEGLLQSAGPGRRREVALTNREGTRTRVLRVGVLLSDPLETINFNSQMVVLGMIRRIENTGHVCFMAETSVRELGGKIPRISRVVEGAKADAWVIYCPPRNLLEWFSRQPIPVISFGGINAGVPVSGTVSEAGKALESAIAALTELGHRRIVTISPESWRPPSSSQTAKSFLEALEKHGHQPTIYNLPAWENSSEGLAKLLEELFRITPPTALLFVDPVTYVAALGFLSQRGLRVPQDISVICMTSSPILGLLPRRVAHFKWPVEKHIHLITSWVEQVANGSHKLTQTQFHATFDPGETIGPAKGRISGKH